jgi:hypothetical protein
MILINLKIYSYAVDFLCFTRLDGAGVVMMPSLSDFRWLE